MPWELHIVCYRNGESTALGTRQAVIDHMATTFPGETFGPPPLPPQVFLDKMTPENRALFLKPTLRLLHDEADLSFEFWCPDAAEINCLFTDVRGVGNPTPVLRRLCLPPGWTVFDLGDYQRHWRTCSATELVQRASVDLDAPYPRQWGDFSRWLDEAIGQVNDD